MLSPLLKQLVDRLRPIVDMPVATAGGPSFPSGHTLAATVWVGVVLLVLLPVVPPRRRRIAVAAGVAVVVVVGLTRIALGVHFVSDVLAGWLVGIGWLLVTASAFRAWRRSDGLAVPSAVDGLAPEVAGDLEHAPGRPSVHPWTTVAQLLVTAVLLLGAVVGVGLLIVHVGTGTAFERADIGVVQWLADHRVPWLDTVSAPLAEMGNTKVIVVGGSSRRCSRSSSPVGGGAPLVIATVLVGEVLIFLAAVAVVGRPRPPVAHLDGVLPPTSSFPSGHTAAAICLYGALAALVLRGTRAWWRWLVLALAVALVVGVAFARLYRGAHHPTDVLASVAFAVPWLLVTLRLVADEPGTAGPEWPGHVRVRRGGPILSGAPASVSVGACRLVALDRFLTSVGPRCPRSSARRWRSSRLAPRPPPPVGPTAAAVADAAPAPAAAAPGVPHRARRRAARWSSTARVTSTSTRPTSRRCAPAATSTPGRGCTGCSPTTT